MTNPVLLLFPFQQYPSFLWTAFETDRSLALSNLVLEYDIPNVSYVLAMSLGRLGHHAAIRTAQIIVGNWQYVLCIHAMFCRTKALNKQHEDTYVHKYFQERR